MENKDKTIGWLLLAVVSTTLISYMLLDTTKANWLSAFWGLIGTNVSVIGIAYTIYQVKLLKTKSEIIAETTRETKEKIAEIKGSADIARGIKLIQEIQGYARSAKYESGVMRLQELKVIIGHATPLNQRLSQPADLDSVIRDINQLINGMEKEILHNGSRLKATTVNSNLEEITDLLIRIQTTFK